MRRTKGTRIKPKINIRNHVPLILGTEEGNYNNWVALFTVQCTVCQVLDHIIPPENESSAHDSEWERLDAIVLQWIYSTITPSLLTTILKVNNTAAMAWSALEKLFIDSKPSRALYLRQKFCNIKLDNFADATTYCRELKYLSDQLTNVDSPVDDQQLVMQLIAGLSPEYDNLATVLHQGSKFPDFETARSQLVMEEDRKNQQKASALLTVQPKPTSDTSSKSVEAHTVQSDQSSHQRYSSRGPEYSSRGPEFGRGRGRGGRSRNRGRSRGRGGYHQYYSEGYYPPSPWHTHRSPWQSPTFSWPNPPCPYPTYPTNRPPPRAPGILGAPPSANYAASDAYTPTNLDQALHAMSLNQDQNWYMDTGATSHMSHTPGILSSYVNNCSLRPIVVGNGSQIQTSGLGHSTLPPPFPPLKLPNILISPSLIKNLLSVRRLTTDNDISIEFDRFGFLVKDFQTRLPIFRSNSSGDLYPLSVSNTKVVSPSAFAALTQDLWHH